MIALLSVLALAATTIASPLAASVTATSVLPNPTEVYVNSISYGGTGCPQGTVGSFISADRQTFRLPLPVLVYFVLQTDWLVASL
jgi:hypothetical protein